MEPPYTERYVRWCERSAIQLMDSLLLDYNTTNFKYFLLKKFIRDRMKLKETSTNLEMCCDETAGKAVAL